MPACVSRRVSRCRGLAAAGARRGSARADARSSFAAGVDLVRLPVVVTGAGRPARARADGRQTSRSSRTASRRRSRTSPRARPARRVPLHLGLLLDSSEQHGARPARGRRTPPSSSSTRSTRPWTSRSSTSTRDVASAGSRRTSYPQLFERIRDAEGRRACTALYDALGVYLETALRRDGPARAGALHRRRRQHEPDDLRQAAASCCGSATSIVYAIGYLENQLQLAAHPQQMRLHADRARDRRRRVLPDVAAGDCTTVYAQILDELGSRYTLGYVPGERRGRRQVPQGRGRIEREGIAAPEIRSQPELPSGNRDVPQSRATSRHA